MFNLRYIALNLHTQDKTSLSFLGVFGEGKLWRYKQHYLPGYNYKLTQK